MPSSPAGCRQSVYVRVAVGVVAIWAGGFTPLTASPSAQRSGRPAAAPVQKIRDGVYRIGKIEVDTVKKELTVPGTANSDVTTLEFVANTAGGAKAYESALTLETDGVTFNAAMLLLGVDPAHSRVPKEHFDPVAPKGDPVEIWVDWTAMNAPHHVRIEQLLFDDRTKSTLSEGPWVYTGSSFLDRKYMADLDGVLIGFVHSPSPVIENPRAGAVSAYGSVVMNYRIGLIGGMKVVVTVKALPVKRP